MREYSAAMHNYRVRTRTRLSILDSERNEERIGFDAMRVLHSPKRNRDNFLINYAPILTFSPTFR